MLTIKYFAGLVRVLHCGAAFAPRLDEDSFALGSSNNCWRVSTRIVQKTCHLQAAPTSRGLTTRNQRYTVGNIWSREWKIYLSSKLRINPSSVKVKDILLDSTIAKKLLHGQPRRVADAEQHQYCPQNVSNWFGWHLQGPLMSSARTWECGGVITMVSFDLQRGRFAVV